MRSLRAAFELLEGGLSGGVTNRLGGFVEGELGSRQGDRLTSAATALTRCRREPDELLVLRLGGGGAFAYRMRGHWAIRRCLPGPRGADRATRVSPRNPGRRKWVTACDVRVP